MVLSRLEYLFARHVNQECSSREQEELMQLLAKPENEAAVKKLITQVVENTGAEFQMPDHVSDSILQNIMEADRPTVVPLKTDIKPFRYWGRIAAAAVVILVAGAVYWLTEQKSAFKSNIVAAKPARIMPGTKRASLTIADGSIISLDSTQNGTLAQQGSTLISKKDGLLVYNANAFSNKKTTVMFNTLSTPRGGQYEVMLPDGSRVWLNAASQLRYPANFSGDHRDVELTGEAYFEVAKNKKKPFRVNVGGMQVEVLGTTFNVNGYTEEGDIITSLLEGSVKVAKGDLKDLLKPGQQAILNKKKKQIKIADADLDEAIAWKNGLFQFKSADVAAIMRQVGRWYNVEIIYPGKIPVRQFEGKISRQAELSDVLQILELSNIKFTVEGKKIIVH